jgi:dolichol-phosphate mannosyltransferase
MSSLIPQVSIILPTYNEKENIVTLVSELRDGFRNRAYRYEIIVVDDSSPDQTADVVRQSFSDDPNIKLIVRRENRGLANSIKEGMYSATGSVILVMDTDFNHKPADAILLFEIAQHVDVAVGSRFIFGGGMKSAPRYYLSFLFNVFLRVLLGTMMNDNLSGFFAIKRDSLHKLNPSKIFWGYGDYYFRLLLLSQEQRFKHVELPVFYGDRIHGESKTRFLRIFWDYTKAAFYVLYLKACNKW